ncbi:Fibrocystin-L [Mizuhopecten yessoensis]|uniref:Fibrocystin-L n=1 Tax=Mizuhopecten yessoensis TaxID=6573 RepID=A0A210QH74_MIZYE|nr:Fibrocystin-L [Mizuhopecten yessoensis]
MSFASTDCDVVHLNDTAIICRTVRKPDTNQQIYPGNRGIAVESWNETFGSEIHLQMIRNFNESLPDYQMKFSETTRIPGNSASGNYVSRMKVFFLPPFDGEYQFILTSTRNAEFYLSRDGDPAGMQLKISSYSGYATMLLHSNTSYYMEVLYRQTTNSRAINLAVRYLDSKVNHHMAGNVLQEEQEISITSSIQKEQQAITILNVINQTPIFEEQEIIVEESGGLSENGRFRLGLYSLYTESILFGVSAIDMTNALKSLPVFDVSETVSINRTAHGQGFKYTITFISERGNFPELELKTLSGTFTARINTTRDGKPSGKKVGLMMAGVPAPLIDSNGSQSQISEALGTLFTVRCPSYWTDPKRKIIYHNMEDYSSLPWYLRGLRKNQYQAFCGNWILRNPSWLLYKANIYISINPMFCMAFKGFIYYVYMDFTYTNGNGRKTNSSHYFNNLVNSSETDQWNYACYNLQDSITTIISDASIIILHGLQIGCKGDVLVDDVYFGQHATTLDTDDAHLRRLVCAPNGYKITDVDVAKHGDTYDISLTTVLGGHGFPIFTVDDTQVPPNTTVSVIRTVAASTPLSGTFDLTLRGQTITSIPVGIGRNDITAIIEGFTDIGLVLVTSTGDGVFNMYWRFRFDTYPGNLEQIQMNSSTVSGDNVQSHVWTIQNGQYTIDPLYGEMLMTAHETPQVTVSINDVASKCTGSCTFEWLPSKTPVLDNVTRVQGISHTKIQISGSGFSDIPNNNNVTIKGVVCNVTMATNSTITCDIDSIPSGEHIVVVNVLGSGIAKSRDGNLTISFNTQIDGVNPTRSGMGGSVKLSITGSGFNRNSSVKLGAKTCDVQSVSTTNIVCLVPSTSTAEVVPVTVEQNGELQLTADTNFTYDDSKTPRVTGISPNLPGVSGGDTLIIDGDGFQMGDNLTLLVGRTEINITFYNNTYVTAELPPCSPGSHHVKVIAGDNGAGMTLKNKLPSITCVLELTSVNPLSGSLFGGTSLTLEGQGFTSLTKVKVGNHDCDVTTTNGSFIICKITRTRTIHRVNNHGNHPSFGKYYYWSPQHIKVLVGDIVRWDWDFPFYITTMKPKVEETYNMTTKYGKSGGFTSGAGSSTGSYSREFSKAGKFYYWSGIIDEYSITWFYGSVEVVDGPSFLADVSVTHGHFEATYNVTDSTSIPDTTTCCDTTVGRYNCSDPLPVDSSNHTKFQFAFWTCRTPVIDSISRQNGTTNDEILISGNGFSDKSSSNNVTFGDYICKASYSSVSSLACSIDPENKPRIGRPQYIDVLVNNLGYAHVNVEAEISKTFALFPVINIISPNNGSLGGYTRLTISGTGFEERMGSIRSEVNVGGYHCDIVSSSYTKIICLTPMSSRGQREISVIIPAAGNTRIRAECNKSCQFVYDDLLTPTVTDVSPKSITGENTTSVTIVGTGFGDDNTSVSVVMTSSEHHHCAITDVSDSNITCLLNNLPLGSNTVVVHISHKGRAREINGPVTVASIASVQNISPDKGSKYGGTDITVTGNGFHSDVTIDIDGTPCLVLHRTVSSVVCTTEVHAIGNAVLTIRSDGHPYPEQAFTYSEDASPRIITVYPSSGTSGENITISGYNLGTILNHTSVFVGETNCEITAVNETEINCTVGENRAGKYNICVNVHGLGNSNADATFTFSMSVKDITPRSGSVGGDQTVTILGTGFDDNMMVTICDRICNISERNTTESMQYVCHTPSLPDSSLKNCSVHVTVNNVTETLADAYTYDPVLTPVIDDVTPKRGGTQGGTRITISGSNFGLTEDTTFGCTSSVTIAGTLCNITSWTNTRVVCVTEAHSRSERAAVRLETGCNGKAKENNARFHFVDVWSSVYTWGGQALGLPKAGDIVVIQKGQTILFDTNTPVLKMLVIQGGELVFDEANVELQAENILITDGGLLQVGTEAEPFKHKAIITLHGHHRSKELPVYGTKSLAVREGTLDLHGQRTTVTWTKLAQSVDVGNTTIILQHEVNWRKGDIIIISTTGGIHSYSESEKLTILSVAVDNKTITLTSPLNNAHLGLSELVAGWDLDFSAEVGLLTRNVVVRGRSDPQWIMNVESCPDDFDSGNLALQKCAQGRYGQEMGSDQFGAHVIIHTTDPTKHLTTSRVEFVEFVHVGQAFRLGRHPINFHMTGDMSKSYVRGCGIYDTFNRAINIRDTHNLLVERNVIYNVNGAAIYLEDGTETGNLFQYNLGVLVKGSSQLLNDDISAATFWITNPNNTFRHNVAAGGTHFGYWFYLENIATSSLNGRYRPQYTPLGEFNNNTAHSLGWYGLLIYPIYTPRVMYSFNSSPSSRKAAVINNMYVWNCRKGIEIADIGAVHIKGFIAVNNVYAGYEGKMVVEGNQYTDDGPLVENSLIVGYVPSMPSQGCTN